MADTPAAKTRQKSRASWRWGCTSGETEMTTAGSKNLRISKAAAKKTRMITPRVTGGRPSMNGQTCPPYTVRTRTAKR